MKLSRRLIEKPWGRTGIDPAFGADPALRIGECWFEFPPGLPQPVMVKYLFTSERLSIQVHPDNAQARARGHANGKDEAWIVLAADADARIGLDLVRPLSTADLRAAILDGSIEALIDWRPARVGDVIYNRAGTIHAAGAGLVLLEVQQSIDLTYRLYDYGRPRPLHLEDGLAVARTVPDANREPLSIADGRSRLLFDGPHFGIAWCAGEIPAAIPAVHAGYQIVPLSGCIAIGSETVSKGECALVPTLDAMTMPQDARAAICWASPASDAA
jgi:mannose-6-phosphate isomerase